MNSFLKNVFPHTTDFRINFRKGRVMLCRYSLLWGCLCVNALWRSLNGPIMSGLLSHCLSCAGARRRDFKAPDDMNKQGN